jgi:thiamine biosynthesis lipoprotein
MSSKAFAARAISLAEMVPMHFARYLLQGVYRSVISFKVGLVLLGLALLTGCDNHPVIQKYSGNIMGTTYHVSVLMLDNDEARQQIAEGIHQTLVDIDLKMSTYKPHSELSRFNQTAPGEWFDVSTDTGNVISEALDLSVSSQGAFDPTVGPLVNLWGFGPDLKPNKIPDELTLAEAFTRVGYGALRIEPQLSGSDNSRSVSGYRVKKDKDIYLDLSAIAKGYGVDKVALYLEKSGYKSYLVEVGGEIRVKGAKPNGSLWRIAIEKPVSDGQVVQGVMGLSDIAVATSGSYRNYFEYEGQRYSHTINPANGQPINHTLASVTVLHPSCASADALATTLMVMGPEKGFKYAQDNNLAVYMLVKSGDEFTVKQTPQFLKMAQLN